jgi:Flp pilus assembly protein TadD
MAEQICRGALEQFPTDANILCLSAKALMRLNRPDVAEQRANAALAIYPDYPRPHEILGDLFMGRGKVRTHI